MQENIQTIMEWSAATFPDATTIGQIKKFKEERAEWSASNNEDIAELADMFIVAAGIGRLDPMEAMYQMEIVARELYDSRYATRDLRAAVAAKMKINRERRWRSENGQYKHEKDGK